MNNSSKQSDTILLGKVIGVHGLKGVCKVYFYTESTSLFKADDIILLRDIKCFETHYQIVWLKPHKKHIFLMALEGIKDRNHAESLIGSELLIDKKRLSEPEKNSYYWNDIIGLSVFDDTDQLLGIIESIIETGSNDVYVVRNKAIGDDYEILIPALESVVLKIDLKQKTMHVNLPEGL